jgi:hypothetical protein
MDFVIGELLTLFSTRSDNRWIALPQKSAHLRITALRCGANFFDASAPAASTGPQVFADYMQEQVHIDSGRNVNTKVYASSFASLFRRKLTEFHSLKQKFHGRMYPIESK